MKTLFLPLLAGALYPLGFAPFDWWPVTVFSLILLLKLLNNSDRKKSIYIGISYGLGLGMVGLSWVYVSIYYYGNINILGSILLTFLLIFIFSLFYGLISYLYKLLKVDTNIDSFLIFPLVWVFVEIIRSHIFTGFPWLILGTSLGTSFLDGWTPILGVYGNSFILVVISSSVYLFINRINEQRSPKLPLIIFLIISISSVGFKQINWTEQMGEILVSIHQPNLELSEKWSFKGINKTKKLIEQTISDSEESEFIFFPETAIIQTEDSISDWLEQLEIQAKKKNVSLITGITGRNEKNKLTNRIQAFGSSTGFYDKERLVPFGEYIPLIKHLGEFLNILGLQHLNRVGTAPGNGSNSINTGNIVISPSICYEIAFSGLIKDLTVNANILLTISNDTWFGRSIGPAQHLEIAQNRAIEHQMSLIRSTNSGISALIDKRGRILSSLGYFERGQIKQNIEIYRGSTPYNLYGNFFIYLIMVMIFTVILYIKRTYVR